MSTSKSRLRDKEGTKKLPLDATCIDSAANAVQTSAGTQKADQPRKQKESSTKPTPTSSSGKDVLTVRGRRYPRNSLIHNWGLRLLDSMLHDEAHCNECDKVSAKGRAAACQTDKSALTKAKSSSSNSNNTTSARGGDDRLVKDDGGSASSHEIGDVAVLCARHDAHNILHCTQLHRSNGAILVGGDDRSYESAFYVRINMLVCNAARAAILSSPSCALAMPFCPCQAPHACDKLHVLPDVVFVRTQGVRTAFFVSELHHNLGFRNVVQEPLLRQCAAWCHKTHSHIIATCRLIHYKHNSNMHAERATPPRIPSALVPEFDPALLLSAERKRRQHKRRDSEMDGDEEAFRDNSDEEEEEGKNSSDEEGTYKKDSIALHRKGRSCGRNHNPGRGSLDSSAHNALLSSPQHGHRHRYSHTPSSRRGPTQDLSHLLHTTSARNRDGAEDDQSSTRALAGRGHVNPPLESGVAKVAGSGACATQLHGAMFAVGTSLRKRGCVAVLNDILVKGNSVIALFFVLSLLISVSVLIMTILWHLPNRQEG